MNKIYIGNLPFSTNENQLEEAFAQYGNIEDVFLVRDRATGRLKGFGFVTFGEAAAADAALAMDGQSFFGRNIKVSIAKEKEKSSGGDRGGFGGGGDRGGFGGGRDRR